MHHYNYMLVSESLKSEIFYIGVRSSVCPPEEDVTYMSSSRIIDSMLLSGVKFRKEIIDTSPTRIIANQKEQDLFDELCCIERSDCANLHSNNTPYSPDVAANKILCFKGIIPGWDPRRVTPIPNQRLSRHDLRYRVFEYQNIWIFLAHPDNLIEYYPTTGTKVYSPGRKDMLQRDGMRVGKKYYTTDMSNITGTPEERIELLKDHILPGQSYLVQKEIARLQKIIKLN